MRETRYTGRMDVYDFDNTLYRGDSTADFTLHCLWRYQRTWKTLPRTAAAFAQFAAKKLDKTSFKGTLYRYLAHVPDVQDEVARFWQTHEQRIYGPCTPQPGDLVISASPEFLLRDVCTRHGWLLLASPVDPLTGATLGPNCSGAEKVRRFREAYPSASIERFYSDSRNDDPLAHLAQEAFMVKGGKLVAWPDGPAYS